jgi:hypothetical protein
MTYVTVFSPKARFTEQKEGHAATYLTFQQEQDRNDRVYVGESIWAKVSELKPEEQMTEVSD